MGSSFSLTLAVLAALVWPPGQARAAPVSWTGGGDGVSFGDSDNWSSGGVPGATEDVTIAANVLVVAGPADELNLASLTLGDGISSPTLRLSTGTLYVGSLVVKASATLEADTDDLSYFGDVTVEAGGALTHAGPGTASVRALRVQARSFTLQAGATVTVTGKGWAGGTNFGVGAGPGGGVGGDTLITGGGGGGHGAAGGNGANYSGSVGKAGGPYDSWTSPAQAGSGGGSGFILCPGGAGGGVFDLWATTAVLQGLVEANGAPGVAECNTTGGGGAGGTIRIRTQALYGAGALRADGGGGGNSVSGSCGGGGAGGRIALSALSENSSALAVSAAFGTGGFGPNSGSWGYPGTTNIDPKIWTGGGGSSCSDPANWYANIPPQPFENVLFGSTSPAGGCSWDMVMIGGSLGSLTLGPGFQGVVNWATILSSVAGNFNIYGGTFTMNTNVELRLGGDWRQTGGKFELGQGTVTFNGSGAQTITQTPAGYFNDVNIQGAAGQVAPGSDLFIRGSISPGARWLNDGYVVTLGGTLSGTFASGMGWTTWVFAGTRPQTESLGPYFGVVARNPAGVSFSGAGSLSVGPGGFLVDPGGRADLANRRLALAGSFINDDGVFTASGSTLAFVGSGSDVFLSSGQVLGNLDVQKPAGTLLWGSSATVAGNVTLRSSSTLALVDGATLSVRGWWTQAEMSRLDGASGAVVFDGTQAQVVSSSGSSAFHHFISSNAVSVRLSTGATVWGNLELRRGALDISSVTLRLQGDLLRRGGSLPGISSSTVVLEGSALQVLDLGAGPPELGSLVIANAGPGVSLANDLLLRRDFTVLPGAVFDASSWILTMAGNGSRLSTSGATYLSSAGHTLRLSPSAGAANAVVIAASSTVNGRLEVLRGAVVQSSLTVTGSGNALYLGPGAWLDSRGATVTLGGGCDAAFSAGSGYLHDAGSWLVFAGPGAGRGVGLSTGPLGGLRLRGDASSTFTLGTMTLDGDLVLESGTLLNSGNATLTLKGSLRNEGGALSLADQSTGTLRMGGAAQQTLKTLPGDLLGKLEVAGSSSVVLASPLTVLDLRLSTGILRGGTALLDLKGAWDGRGGRFLAEGSTVAFSSSAAGAVQSYSDALGASFNGLSVQVSTLVFSSTFSASVLTSTRPGNFLVFAPVAGGDYRVGDLRVAGLPASRVHLRSATPGSPFRLDVLAVSTVTAADVQDSSATGKVIHANDGTSIDLGGNWGWNFHANLVLVMPGETFVEGSGKTGAPSVQVAGTTFTVTVMAVSDIQRRILTSTLTVSLATSDGFDAEPSPRALSAGAAQLDVTLRTAEPYPLSAVLTASSSQAFSATSVAVRVDPAAFDRLQLLLPGEGPLPGSGAGRAGSPSAQLKGAPVTAIVRAVDRFFNRIPGAVDTVALATATASSATLPSPAPLVDGELLFPGVRIYSTGTLVLVARDLTAPSVGRGYSLSLSVFQAGSSSPTLAFQIPSGALVSSLGGALAGTAMDGIAVTEVRIALRDNATLKFRDWGLSRFSSDAPVFLKAVLRPLFGPRVDWEADLADAALASGGRRDYYAVAVASNPSGLTTMIASTFTFDSGFLAYGAGGGEGSASVAPASTAACRPVVSTVTFTAGGSGIGPGGVVALRLPPGWGRLEGRDAGPVPPLGYVAVLSTSAVWPSSAAALLNPPSLGAAALGDGWIALVVSTAAQSGLRPGEQVRFVVHALPMGAPGERPFELRTSSGAGTPLIGISSAPIVTLTTGPAQSLRFDSYAPMALGPLQTSATLQLQLVDGCGNPTPAQAQVQASLSAAVPDGAARDADSRAEFFKTAGGGPVASVCVAAGSAASESFYYRTSTAGPGLELVRATAVLAGLETAAERLVSLRGSSVALSAVSIDTGTLASGATSAVLVPGLAGARAVVRFLLPDPEVDWEVLIASDPAFASPVFRGTGQGDPGRPIETAFNGLSCDASGCRFVPPGLYKVRLRAGGAAEDRSLEVRVPVTASIRGSLGPQGARARVWAEGPGTGPGNTTEADAAGGFEIFGLKGGGVYAVAASTEVPAFGRLVELSTRVAGAAAVGGGSGVTASVGSPSALRLSAVLPVAYSDELWGSVLARRVLDGAIARTSLHFPQGGANSDDGAQASGRAASTWTVLGLAPGVYDVELQFPGVGISSRVAGVALAPGAATDLALRLLREATVCGRVRLPAAEPAGATLTVEARKAGDPSPSAYASAALPPVSDQVALTSAVYRLYGLSAGTWTLRASGPGFVSASTAVLVSGTDLGDPATGLGGPELLLGRGAVITGTVTVRAGAARLPASPTAVLEAYEPLSGRLARAAVRLFAGEASSTASFSLGGLEAGVYRLSAFLDGFETVPPGPLQVAVSSVGASVPLELGPAFSRLSLTVRVPRPAAPCRCAADFSGVGMILGAPGAPPRAWADVTALDGTEGSVFAYHESSMTFLTPPLGNGFHEVRLRHGPSGGSALVLVPLANGATVSAEADLRSATYTVSGTVSLSGSLHLSRGAFTVTISSVSGLLSEAGTTSYCLLSSSVPVLLPSARVELVPWEPGQGAGPLLRASGAACARPDPGGEPRRLLAYAAGIAADGRYSIRGVPAGTYELRVPSGLDADPAGAPGMAPVSRIVRVDGDSREDVALKSGAAVSGELRLPRDAPADRSFAVLLVDADGRTAASAVVQSLGRDAVPFSLQDVGDGRYALSVRDLGFPRAFAARPVSVEVAGGVDGLSVGVGHAGAIKGRIVVERPSAGGGSESISIAPSNRGLLPRSLRVVARAQPWTEGGLFPAAELPCAEPGCPELDLDAEGRFTVPAVLGGTYGLELEPGDGDAGSAALDLVPEKVSGVVVPEGQTVDVGVVRLRAASALSGRVVGPRGDGLANVAVEARPSASGQGGTSSGASEARTDPEGRYVLPRLDPAVRFYDVTAAPARPEEPLPYASRTVPQVDIRSTTTLDFSLEEARLSVSGTVVSAAGEPLLSAGERGPEPGALVYVQRDGVLPRPGLIGDTVLRTGPDGRFTLSGLSPGSYRITATALDHVQLTRLVPLSTAPVALGVLELGRGATLEGAILGEDGSPGRDEVDGVLAMRGQEVVSGSLDSDPNTLAVTGYRVSGLKAGEGYRLALVTRSGEMSLPDEAQSVVFTSSVQLRRLDLVFRRPRPYVLSKSRRDGEDFLLEFQLSQPLRSRRPADGDLAGVLSTVSARGGLSGLSLSADRRTLGARYIPAVGESSFTLRLRGYSLFRDPDSIDPLDPEFVMESTVTFFAGLDGLHRTLIPNAVGGDLALEGDAGRLSVPQGAFRVSASSAVEVALQRSREALSGSGTLQARGVPAGEANLRSLRFPAEAYPADVLRAVGAVPPQVVPLSAFYDVLLPSGVRGALARPAQLTLSYATGTDPSRLNVYWYNAAANAYILQQDVTGAAPAIDRSNRTFGIRVDHFSTFVLFESGVAAISGNACEQAALEAFSFPNPFDLSEKTVTPIHGAPPRAVRGTMMRIAVPPDVRGDGAVRIFNAAGERVRTIDLGSLSGGRYYYEPWDGRNDSGRDVASGVYVGQVKVGGRSAFFKMAVIK